MPKNIVAAVAGILIVNLCVAGEPHAVSRKQTEIPAQPLAQALTALAKQRKFEVFYRSDLVRGLQTEGAAGNLTTAEAIGQLLRGTGLRSEFLGDNTVTIVPSSDGNVSARGKADRNSRNDHDGAPGTRKEGKTSSSGAFRMAQSYGSASEESADQARLGDAHGDTTAVLEEVVVTAEKRPERLIEVPESISVVSGDELARMGATQFSDFASTIPGLSFQTGGAGFTQITLRGVTTGFDVSPTVAVYVDDVPYGSSTAFAQGAQLALDVGLFDLKRIEVLRGPQGTLYGASTMGGLIKYVTEQPNLARTVGEVRAGVSDTADGGISYDGSVSVNAPILHKVAAVRATAFYSRDGGYIDNLALGQTHADRSGTLGARVALLFAPTDAMTIRLTGFLQNITRDGESTVDYTLAGVPKYGQLDQYRKFSEPYDQHFRLVSANVDYDFGAARLTSISSYQTMQEDNIWDISSVYVSLLGPSYGAVGLGNASGTNKVTQELRLTSTKSAPLTWVAGAFYTREKSWYSEDFLLRNPQGAALPNNLYAFWSPSSYQEYAGFGDVTVRLSRKLDMTGGFRYSHDSQDYTQFGSGLFIGSLSTGTSREGVFTYLGNVRYHLDSRATAYLRYATGFRPGGPNLAAKDPVTGQTLGPATFQPDRLNSYEVGLKAETASQRAAVDMDVYDIDWKNIQIFAIRDGFGFRTNATGGAAVQGAELSLTTNPLQALALTAVVAYQHAYLKAGDMDLGAAPGERLPNVPRYSGSVNADYIVSNNGLRPTFGGTLRYVADRTASYNSSASDPQYRLPAYTLVDIRGGITVESVELELYVRNVFNGRAQLSDMLPQFGPRIALTEPRTIGLNLEAQF